MIIAWTTTTVPKTLPESARTIETTNISHSLSNTSRWQQESIRCLQLSVKQAVKPGTITTLFTPFSENEEGVRTNVEPIILKSPRLAPRMVDHQDWLGSNSSAGATLSIQKVTDDNRYMKWLTKCLDATFPHEILADFTTHTRMLQ